MTRRARPRSGHDTFEHTADIGLEAWGASLEELFNEAAAGLLELVLEPDCVEGRAERTVSAQGESPEELLVGWLEEILYAFEAEGFAPADARVVSLGNNTVDGLLRGEKFDPDRHARGHIVKAVTYHALEIKRSDGTYEVRIVIDI
jgi:SHS2 domain-containing protein